MSGKAIKVIGIAAVLSLAVAFAASAAPVGRMAAVTPDLAQFFSSQGVDAQYLTMPQSQVPADQWSKIVAILSTPDDTVNKVYYHGDLVGLINAALVAATHGNYDPVYITIGDMTWQLDLGTDPVSANALANDPSSVNWVPLG